MAASAAAPVAAAGSAEAAAKLPSRAKAVLDYLRDHPITVTSQSLQYDAEPTTPLPNVARGLTPDDCRVAGSAPGSRHADCLAGALLTACGGLDAAHNIVTPLSWGSFTPYAGKPVACSPCEAADASYVHAMIHRQEGSADGEFGTGFSNANYWYRNASGARRKCGHVEAAAWCLAVSLESGLPVHSPTTSRSCGAQCDRQRRTHASACILHRTRRHSGSSRRRPPGAPPRRREEARGRLRGQAPAGPRGGPRGGVERHPLCGAVRPGGSGEGLDAAAVLRGGDGGGAEALCGPLREKAAGGGRRGSWRQEVTSQQAWHCGTAAQPKQRQQPPGATRRNLNRIISSAQFDRGGVCSACMFPSPASPGDVLLCLRCSATHIRRRVPHTRDRDLPRHSQVHSPSHMLFILSCKSAGNIQFHL